jgi:hypothetical protein
MVLMRSLMLFFTFKFQFDFFQEGIASALNCSCHTTQAAIKATDTLK